MLAIKAGPIITPPNEKTGYGMCDIGVLAI